MTEGMISAADGILQMVTKVLSAITDNPVLMIFFTAGLLFMAARLIRSLKRV